MKHKVFKICSKNYTLFVENFVDNELFSELQFHPKELARIQGVKNIELLQQRSRAYSLLRLNSDFWIQHAKNGEPLLMEKDVASNFSISFSHKKNVVAALISACENQSVGVDLEVLNTEKDFNFLKDKIISLEESYHLADVKIIYRLSDKDSCLFFWVLKEAAFKAVRGTFDLSDFNIELCNNEIILTCIHSDNIFESEVFVVNNNLIAVVVTAQECKKISTE